MHIYISEQFWDEMQLYHRIKAGMFLGPGFILSDCGHLNIPAWGATVLRSFSCECWEVEVAMDSHFTQTELPMESALMYLLTEETGEE